MRKLKFTMFAGVLLFCAGVVHADSIGDGRVGVQPAPPGDPPPSCNGSSQVSASTSGNVSYTCNVDGAKITSITVAVLGSESNGGLSLASPLTTNLSGDVPEWVSDIPAVSQFFDDSVWSYSCTEGAIDECTLTAPQIPTTGANGVVYSGLNAFHLINDGDCDSDDFIFGIPTGCGIDFTTVDGLPVGDDALVDISTNGAPLAPFTPEPSTAILFGLGILAMVPFVLRQADQSTN